MNKKGAFNVMALIMGFITIICYVAMLPILNDVIADGIPYADPWTALILELIPLIIILMVIWGIVSSGQEVRYGM